MSRKAVAATLVSIALLPGCGGDDKKKSTTKASTTATSTSPSPDAVRGFQTATGKYLSARQSFIRRVNADAKTGNIPAATSQVAQFRTAVFNFDKELRALTVPPQVPMNPQLEANAALIGDLDGLAAVKSTAEFNRQNDRVNTDQTRVRTARQAVARALGTPAQ